LLLPLALVVDSSNNFHGVLVDAGNGRVLASTQMSMASIEQSGMGINPAISIPVGPGTMGPGTIGPGMFFLQPHAYTTAPGMGMMQHGMMQEPGMMRPYP